jgi:hypothetical protein
LELDEQQTRAGNVKAGIYEFKERMQATLLMSRLPMGLVRPANTAVPAERACIAESRDQ